MKCNIEEVYIPVDDNKAIELWAQGVPIYTKGSDGYEQQLCLVTLINNYYNRYTMFQKTEQTVWEGEWEEGGIYLCHSRYGKSELKFYHKGLLWDSRGPQGYAGNNLLSKYKEVVSLEVK